MTAPWNGRPPAPIDELDSYHWISDINGNVGVVAWNAAESGWGGATTVSDWMPPETVQQAWKYIGVALTPDQIAAQIAEAVKAEREEDSALIRSLAVGYERMHRALCQIFGTSGCGGAWYRDCAQSALTLTSPIYDIAQNPNHAAPGECSWINRDGGLDAIRARGETA